MRHYTADWHLFHKQILGYCNRPFKNESEMRKILITNYNQTVRKNDTCFFLGDMAMLGPSQWEHLKGVMKHLNGTKHLMFGNHDDFKWQRYLDIGFTTVHSALWLEDGGLTLLLAHDPAVYAAVDDKSVLLCGHVHILFKSIPDKNVVNVGVDQWDFRPITIDHVKKELGI